MASSNGVERGLQQLALWQEAGTQEMRYIFQFLRRSFGANGPNPRKDNTGTTQ